MPNTPNSAPGASNPLPGMLLWVVIAIGIAIMAFVKAVDPATEKKSFYWVAGVVAVIAAILNGYKAWLVYKQSKLPPAA